MAASTTSKHWTELDCVRNVGRRDEAVVVDFGDDQLWLDFPFDGVVRVRLASGDKPRRGASGVVRRRSGSNGAVEERRGRITVRAPGVEVEIERDPAALTFRDGEGRQLCGSAAGAHAHRGERVRLTQTRASGERIYGLGEKAWGLERSGRSWRMWNTDCIPYGRGTDPMYKSIPFALLSRPCPGMGTDGLPGVSGRAYYGLFFDNPFATTFDLSDRKVWSVEAPDGPLEYYVIAGPGPEQVLERYTALTGRMAMPPAWALGYQQCRWSYTPERRVRKVAATFREKRIPCDVVYLDIDYMDGYRSFTWHPKRFPKPTKMIKDLQKDGFNVVTIIDPGLKAEANKWTRTARKHGYLVAGEDGEPVVGKVWPGRCYFPDFSNPEARTWWGELHAGLLKNGVAGIWNDMNEPAILTESKNPKAKTLAEDVVHHGAPGRRDHRGNHNLYGHHMAQATHGGVLAERPDRRPFILTRAAYAGTQQYAATWTGDNHASWKHLELSVPMLLGLGISGMPFCGADVGGFTGHPTAELFTRWMQAAALTPLFRGHSQKGTPDQEPWSFGTAAEERSRAAVELRYRLMPYLYTAFEESTRTGAPVMRPVWWNYPDDPRAQSVEDAFMIGRDVLVAPVLKRAAKARSVYFPAGSWVALEGRRRPIEGPITKSVSAPIDRLPVFVRAGSVIAMRPVVQHCGDVADDTPLELLVVPDSAGNAGGSVYEDAGDGLEYRKRGYARTAFSFARRGKGFTLEATVEGKRVPPERDVRIEVVGGPDAVEPARVAGKAWVVSG